MAMVAFLKKKKLIFICNKKFGAIGEREPLPFGGHWRTTFAPFALQRAAQFFLNIKKIALNNKYLKQKQPLSEGLQVPLPL